MASSTTEIVQDFSPAMRVYSRVERLIGTDVVPVSLDPITGVQSKDIEIAPEIGVEARLYLPKTADPDHKLPLLVYFHGGGFIIESAFSPTYHNYLNSLAAEAKVVVVSVNYRLAPEHPLPAAYEDSWVAIQWVDSHFKGDGQEPWLKDYVDPQHVFFGGDSAGGNIAHNMSMRVGSEKLEGSNLVGLVLIHPFFWGKEPIGNEVDESKFPNKAFYDKLCRFVNSLAVSWDDLFLNPALNPELSSLGCTRVLVCVAEKDILKDRGVNYKDLLDKSGWEGQVEVMEAKGENHVFHLSNPTCENALALLIRVATFLNQD